MDKPTQNIDSLARYALSNRDFRVRASVAGAFATVVQNDYPYADDLTPEEVQFCEGWLYLARQEYSEETLILDHHIVVAVNAHLHHGMINVMSG